MIHQIRPLPMSASVDLENPGYGGHADQPIATTPTRNWRACCAQGRWPYAKAGWGTRRGYDNLLDGARSTIFQPEGTECISEPAG